MRIKFGSLLSRVCLGDPHLLLIPSKVSFSLCRLTSTEEEVARALARMHSPFGCAVLKAAGRVLFKTVLSSTILSVLNPCYRSYFHPADCEKL